MGCTCVVERTREVAIVRNMGCMYSVICNTHARRHIRVVVDLV